MIDLSVLEEEELKKLEEAHRAGFQAGIQGGEEPNCPYLPDSLEVVFWDKGMEDGTAFRLEVGSQ